MSHVLRIPVGSVEFVSATVRLDGGQTDPTDLGVEMALVEGSPEANPPEEGDWKTAAWAEGGPPYRARLLVGPGQDVVPTPGLHTLWVRLTDTPEIPIRPSGLVEFYGPDAS